MNLRLALLKMLMSDPPLYSRESGMSLIKLFLARNTFGISGFPDLFRSETGKILLRQKYSRPRGKNLPKAEEVFPAIKNFVSDIPGFPAGDADHSFLTVHVLKGGGYLSISQLIRRLMFNDDISAILLLGFYFMIRDICPFSAGVRRRNIRLRIKG
jgi:hypothetical protein